jgi:hypothetical protein
VWVPTAVLLKQVSSGSAQPLIKALGRTSCSLEPGLPDNQLCFEVSQVRDRLGLLGQRYTLVYFCRYGGVLDLSFPSGTAMMIAVVTPLEMSLNVISYSIRSSPQRARGRPPTMGRLSLCLTLASGCKSAISSHTHTHTHTHACTRTHTHTHTHTQTDWPFFRPSSHPS